MKSKQLLIVALVTSLYGMNIVAARAHPLDLTGFDKFYNHTTKLSILDNCKNEFNEECKVLNQTFLNLAKHQSIKNQMANTKKSLSVSKNPRAQTILKEKIKEIEKLYPNYDKSFLETLSSEQKTQLDGAINKLLATLLHSSVEYDASIIDKILSEKA